MAEGGITILGFEQARLKTLLAMLAAVFAFGAGLSLGLPLLSLVLETRGISAGWIGINTAVAAFAALFVTPFVTPVTRRFGAAPVLSAALLITAISLIGFYFLPDFWMWFPLRLVFHSALGFVFVLTEFWLNALAPEDRRGLVMGVYATFLAGGFVVGPLILAATGSGGLLPFVLGALVILVAILPVAAARGQQPDLEGESKHSFLSFIFKVPVATVAALVFGAIEAGGMAIMPLYGIALGYGERDAALIVSAAAAGNIAFQIPIGLLADRMSKVTLLLVCGAVGVVGALAVPLVAHIFQPLYWVLFVWGGVVAGLYTVGISHLGANYRSSDLATANSAFVTMYAIGMFVGPPVFGAGLEWLPPHGPMWAMAAFFAFYLVIGGIWRRRGDATADPA
jgi:MFS family permease